MKCNVVLRASACLLVTLSAGRSAARADVPDGEIVKDEVAQKLDEYLSRLSAIGFSGAIVATKGDDVILQKGYGYADAESKRPWTADTVSTVGSITKQFTGAAVVKLEQDGKLSVSDPISKWFENVPADKQSITIHHLLTHTSGIRGGFGGDWDTQATREWLTQQALSSELLWPPGTRYRYSNAGFSLAAMIVEKASGMGYEEYLQSALFKPAGMTRTGYTHADFTPAELAVGYQDGKRWGTVLGRAMLEDGPCWNLRGNGGIHSTLRDMVRWHRALEGDTILSSSAREKLFAPHADEGGGQSHYGYGWSIVTTMRGTKLITHNGGNGILFADFRRYVDEGVMFFIMTNVAEFPAEFVSPTIAQIVHGHEYTLPPKVVPVDAAALATFAGEYALPGDAKLVVTAEPTRLKITPVGQAAWTLLSGAANSSEEIDRTHQRMIEILEKIRNDDFTAMQAALGGERTVEQVAERWKSNIGAFKEFRVLGTTRAADGMITCVAELQTGRGSETLRFGWNAGHIDTIDAGPGGSDGGLTFVPVSPTEFVPFELRAASPPVRIRFDVPDGSAAPALIVVTDSGEHVLPRSTP